MHDTSYKSMEAFRNNFLGKRTNENLSILDVGSFDVNGSYKPLFKFPSWKYVGLDITKGPNVDIVISDLYNWKEVATESFDVVVSGQALEHIEFIWLTMCEIQRVMKRNALCCLICPSTGPVHKYPIDCWRIQEDGMRALVKWSKLEIISISTPFRGEWSDIVFIGRKN